MDNEYKKMMMEERRRHFMHLSTKGLVNETISLSEDGDPTAQDPTMGGGAPGGAPGGDPTMGGAPGGDPTMGGGAPGGDPTMGGAPGGDPMGGGAPGGDPTMGGAPGGGAPGGGGQPVPGLNAQDGGQDVSQIGPEGGDQAGQDPTAQDQTEPDKDDDDATDEEFDEIENSVDDTKGEIKKLAHDYSELKNLFHTFANGVTSLSDEIKDLKDSFEKRNPDPIEKMSLRKDKSGPFTDTVENYWQTEAPDNYSPEDDNDGEGDTRYEITQSDIDDITDWNEISHGLRDTAESTTLSSLLGL